MQIGHRHCYSANIMGALRWIYSLTQFVQGKSDFK